MMLTRTGIKWTINSLYSSYLQTNMPAAWSLLLTMAVSLAWSCRNLEQSRALFSLEAAMTYQGQTERLGML